MKKGLFKKLSTNDFMSGFQVCVPLKKGFRVHTLFFRNIASKVLVPKSFSCFAKLFCSSLQYILLIRFPT